jgi:hypothetical protein
LPAQGGTLPFFLETDAFSLAARSSQASSICGVKIEISKRSYFQKLEHRVGPVEAKTEIPERERIWSITFLTLLR